MPVGRKNNIRKMSAITYSKNITFMSLAAREKIMKKLLVGILVLGSISVFAKETLSLSCASKRNSTISSMNGYLVWEGVRFQNGKPVPHTNLHQITKGKIISNIEISSPIELGSLDTDELALFVNTLGEVNALKIKTAKYVNISDNATSNLNLVNGFDKDGVNLGGFLVSPMAGLIQKCFSVK